jgi:GrpB-like predicted nucleotidyltransferase (UPF0157 family)/quercetin dioxygenase-like cupin family protein
VKIFRFDQEASMSITDFGSRLRIGPVTGTESRVRVQMMYLPAEGFIGRHETTTRQMFGVVVGLAVVSGEDGKRREIGPGYAAVWEPGEEHDAFSENGATAICIEGEFEMWAMGVTTQEIVVCEYDPSWPEWFESVVAYVWPAIDGIAVRIDHVGSTSVPGLAAKPIIDMDVVVETADLVRPVIERLSGIGYRWRGDFGIPGREAFERPGDVDLPRHNLYLVVEDNKAHLDHWLLRDLLRDDPEAREQYASLKKRNAEVSEDDMDLYVAAKAAFVAQLLKRAREERGLPPVTYWEPDVEIGKNL